ncbi:MAG: septum formation initiator family protein [bacterium]
MKKLPKRTKILLLVLIPIIAVVVGLCFKKAFFGRHRRLYETEAEIRDLKEKKALLEKDLRESQSRDFVEKEARERLNMVYPGEMVVVLPKDDQESKEDSREDRGFNLWQWLRGLF